MKLYENIFKARNTLYARTYDTDTDEVTLETINYVPSLFINSREETPYRSISSKDFLQEVKFKNMQEYRDTVKEFKSTNRQMFGNKSQEQGFIRNNFGDPTANDHKFHTWFFDIEVGNGEAPEGLEKAVYKNDWKPTSHERAAMATITSIQIYDTKSKQFYILGLKKDWKNDNNFTSYLGEIKYFNMESEEKMLKTFLTILQKRNPTVVSGWNSTGYDIPYLTNRITRILDKRNDLYSYDKNTRSWRYNTDCLTGSWVQQLSPVGLIKHREVETNFGKQDEYEWIGTFHEDYYELYKKYTYTSLTSYSLDSVVNHELGSAKVNHDEHADFGEFYKGNYKSYNRNKEKIELSKEDILYDELIEIDREIERRAS